MNKRLLFVSIAIVVAVLALGAVGCKSSKKSTTATATKASTTPAATKTSTTPAATKQGGASTTPSGATVNVAQDASLGKILTDASGNTLYQSANDQTNVSNCNAGCSSIWLPLTLSSGTPTAGTGVTGQLSVITRSDGTKQVTYNGKPLYRYSSDSAPGDTKGNGIASIWSVVTVS